MKTKSVTSKPHGLHSMSLMDFDEISRIVAAARAERSKFFAGHLRALGRPWKIFRGQDDFIRASQLIGAARDKRSAFLRSLLPAWLRMDSYKRGGAGRPNYS